MGQSLGYWLRPAMQRVLEAAVYAVGTEQLSMTQYLLVHRSYVEHILICQLA